VFYGDCVAGADQWVRPYVRRVRFRLWECPLFFSLHAQISDLLNGHNLLVRFYRRNLPHLQRDFKPHFITFVTKLRWTLPENARDIVLSCCCHDHRQKYELYVAVVMPDHVHLILTPLINQSAKEIFSLIEIMRGIKGASARAINQLLGRHGPVWQEESFDHVLRSSEGLDSKIEYVLQNPVRNGLVNSWQEYRWAWQRADRESALMTVMQLPTPRGT
jgi:REP element-mobilizing transposase RayT